MLIPLHAIQEARARLAPYLEPSPVRFSEHYSKRLDARVMCKLELLLPTHAFKVRGALNALLSLPESSRARGVVTASAGNHGLGLAYAGAQTGTGVTVVLPRNTPQVRTDAIRNLGGRRYRLRRRLERGERARAHAHRGSRPGLREPL